MINPKELRIGNWVSFKGLWEGNISEIREGGPSIFSNRGFFQWDGFDPIPLTPEVLEKCGFVKGMLDENYPEEGYYFSLNLNNKQYCDLSLLSGDKNGYYECTLFPYSEWFRYKYLHQLQNLYYALTGEELNYQP